MNITLKHNIPDSYRTSQGREFLFLSSADLLVGGGVKKNSELGTTNRREIHEHADLLLDL